MRLKVTTKDDLTPEQQEELQRLGCEQDPYITRGNTLIFAATCTGEQEQALCGLAYVTKVEPMPMYGLA